MDSHLKWANIKKLTVVLMAVGLFSCNGDYSANGASLNTATNSGASNPTGTSNGGVTCGTNDDASSSRWKFFSTLFRSSGNGYGVYFRS
jgi:hypothetical protein